MYKDNRISPSQMIMMVLLMHRPMYGYEVVKMLRDRYEGIWEPQTGAVYPALRRLQEHGLLSVENRDGKDYYSLKDEGRAWLNEELGAMTSGALFITRTMQIMGEAYLEERGGQSDFVPMEDESPEKQLKIMRELRDKLQNNLKMLEMHIRELEKGAGN